MKHLSAVMQSLAIGPATIRELAGALQMKDRTIEEVIRQASSYGAVRKSGDYRRQTNRSGSRAHVWALAEGVCRR